MSTPPPAHTVRAAVEPVPDDRILGLTWHTAFHIVIVLAVAGLLLYPLPGQTALLWAWPVRPDMTPLLMGAGYTGGAYFFYRVARASRWHTVSLGFWPISVFAFLMMLATILHWDEFSHRHPIFWVWAAFYAITPILVPVVWLRNRRTDPGRIPGQTMVPGPVRLVFAGLGAAELALVVLVFVRPTLAIEVWPWELTPLTARIIAGWFSLTGVFAIMIGYDGRWSAIRTTLEASIVGLSLIAIGVWRAWGDFDPANPARWAFVAFLLTLVAGFGTLLAAMERRAGKLAVP